MKSKSIIIFGGSFDPIHNGHLRVAAHAIEQLGATQLVFVPAKRSPHKKAVPTASGDDRVEMIRLAIKGREEFAASDCELKRPEPSYTIDTVMWFKQEYGADTELFLLIGADGLRELPRWYRIKELMENCQICLMLRPGYPASDIHQYEGVFGRENIEKLESHLLANPLVDVSSTEIRRKLARGKEIGELVPPAVAEYIRKHNLYR